MGRPTSLTPEIMTGIVTLIEHGVHPVVAAGAFGVAKTTYYEWIARGEARDERRPMEPIYADFADAVASGEEKAEAAIVTIAVTRIKTTGDALAFLRARWADRWQERSEVTVNFRREAERLAAETGLDPDELMAEAERIFAAARK